MEDTPSKTWHAEYCDPIDVDNYVMMGWQFIGYHYIGCFQLAIVYMEIEDENTEE